MKKLVLIACIFAFAQCKNSKSESDSAALTDSTSLFDGKTTAGWHTYNKTGKVEGWHVMDGALMTHGKSGDLVSDKEYENFELEFEFNVMPKGNSGLIYKVIERADLEHPFISGPEFQIIDDVNYPDSIKNEQKTGANYDINAPADLTATKPAGQWNKGRLIVNKEKVEHWLNGVLVANYTYGTKEWQDAVVKSKFKDWEYAKAHAKGKICLQDHGDAVSFKNIKIKEL
jgi:Domain of Unknown Function (DUF1080)